MRSRSEIKRQLSLYAQDLAGAAVLIAFILACAYFVDKATVALPV